MERNPIYRTSFTPTAEPGDPVPDGRWEVSVASTYSNYLEYVFQPRTSMLFDGERWTNQLDLRRGFGGGWEAGIKLSTRTDWGGFLDPFVQWWHHRFGLPNGDREKVEHDTFASELSFDGELLFSRPSGTRVEDPVVLLGRRLIDGGERGALTARVSAKLPLGAAATHTGDADVGFQVDGRLTGERWTWFGGAGWTTMSAPDGLDRFARDGAWFGHVAAERDFGPLSAQLQLQAMSAWLEGFDTKELNRAPINFAVGATWDLAGVRWEAAFVEDIRPDSPSLDFTLDVRARKLLGR